MRRWNGWGDEATTAHLRPAVAARLRVRVSTAVPPRDATWAESLSKVPPPRLAADDLYSIEPGIRLRHACGQGFPDLVALRSGQVKVFPDAVATPRSREAVRALLEFAGQRGALVIPWGGGTSVVGHVNPLAGDRPVITLDLSQLSQLESIDPQDRLATFGAGVSGPALETQLEAHGFTLGHFPQSFELSTLGGWIATRSRGQESLGSGSIERLLAGAHVETPAGPLELLPHPASSTGPDLSELVLGSEGRLGVITQATVRVRPLPGVTRFTAVLLPDWDTALDCVRSLAQDNPGLSMVRLSSAEETALQLSMALAEAVSPFVERGLSVFGYGPERCLLLLGANGAPARVARVLADARSRAVGGLRVPTLGAAWQRSRFKSPYLRNTLWEHGYGVETFETAARFSRLEPLRQDLERSLLSALEALDERVDVFTHVSHVYPSGANVYTTALFRLGPDGDSTLQRWMLLKRAACEAIVRHGATISHQHGVGVDHRPYLANEKGELALSAIRDALRVFDPMGLLNPGKLV